MFRDVQIGLGGYMRVFATNLVYDVGLFTPSASCYRDTTARHFSRFQHSAANESSYRHKRSAVLCQLLIGT